MKPRSSFCPCARKNCGGTASFHVAVFRVFDKPDDFDIEFTARAGRHSFVDCVGAEPEFFCERLVDDRDARAVDKVGVAEIAAGQERDLQRAKEVRADLVVPCIGVGIRRRLEALDRHIAAPAVAGNDPHHGRTHAEHARQRGQIFFNALE
jgi:hypothetical protein